MPSNAFTSAGSSLDVSASLPATFDQAGWEALSGWTAIGEVVNLGSYGRSYNLVTHNPLADRETYKRKGSFNSGSLGLQMGRVPSDAGQAILVTARDSDASYSFRVTLQDGTVQYFTGQVMEYTTDVGGTEQITAAAANVEIDSSITEVAAP